jgi:HAD superfamily hydrolase (TIGR01509 family)
MPPQFIYFDLGNVLCFFDREKEVRQVAEVARAPAEKVREALIGERGVLWRGERGEIDERQFHEEFCRLTGSRPEMGAFLDADADIFALNGELVPLVAHLEDAQIPLGILSNTSPSHWKQVSDGRYAILLSAFRETVLSFEVGAAKPEAKIFQRAIEGAGVPAERIFYVDDLPGHVEAARKLGMDAVQYTTTDALVRELLARGVKCNI